MFTNREKKIINLIVNSNQGIYGSALGKICNVSDRSIRSDIKNINLELKKYDVQINSTKKDGYFFLVNDVKKVNEIMAFNSNSDLNEETSVYLPTSQEEREIYICFLLLYSDSFVTLDYLASLTYVSKTTIRNTIKSFQETIQNISNLELEISPIKGIMIKGYESRKRYLLSMILSKNYDNNLSYINAVINIFIPNINIFYEIYDIYTNYFDSKKIIFTDKSIILFTLETIIFLDRTNNSFLLEETYQFNNLNNITLPYSEIEGIFKTKLSSQDKMCLLDALSFKKIISSGEIILNDDEASKVIDEFFDLIYKRYSINLNESDASKVNFILHVNTLIQRIKHEIANDQQFIKEIKQLYPYSFELATNIIPIIQRHYGVKIDESEFSFIAIHLSILLNSMNRKVNTVLIYSNDVSESKLIELKIINKFSEKINFIGSYPIYQLDKILTYRRDIDLIITPIPYKSNSKNVDIIQITPQLSQGDIYNLESYFLKFYFSASTNENSQYESFDKRCFKIYNNKDENKVLSEMIDQLFDLEYINNTKAFFDSIMERENIFPTIYENIWVPHPLETMANKTVFSFAIIKNSNRINLIILCAVKEGDTSKYRDIFERITLLLSENSYINKLLLSNNFDDFIEEFNSIK